MPRPAVLMALLCPTALAFADGAPATQPSTPVSTEEQFLESLRTAKPGDIVQTPFVDSNAIPRAEFTQWTPLEQWNQQQFLLSDKPEYFRTGDGISMQEDVSPGWVRLYLYHVPEPSGAEKTISAVIENLGDAPLTMKFGVYASPKPGGNYHAIAREAMIAYLEKQPAPDAITTRRIPVKGRMVIDPHIDGLTVTKDMVVHALHQFEVDQPARITVFQRDPKADSLKVVDSLPKLPRVLPGFHASGAGRGLFERGSNQICVTAPVDTLDTANGPRVFLVADGKTDPWIKGRDSIDPSSPIENKGNYGVMYHVNLKYKSTDGRRMAVLMTAHRPDNKWCKYTAAVVKINDGVNKGGVISLPANAPRFENLPQAVVMQTYPPAKEGELGEIAFTYSPPGACCLPTPILLVPYDIDP